MLSGDDPEFCAAAAPTRSKLHPKLAEVACSSICVKLHSSGELGSVGGVAAKSQGTLGVKVNVPNVGLEQPVKPAEESDPDAFAPIVPESVDPVQLIVTPEARDQDALTDESEMLPSGLIVSADAVAPDPAAAANATAKARTRRVQFRRSMTIPPLGFGAMPNLAGARRESQR